MNIAKPSRNIEEVVEKKGNTRANENHSQASAQAVP